MVDTVTVPSAKCLNKSFNHTNHTPGNASPKLFLPTEVNNGIADTFYCLPPVTGKWSAGPQVIARHLFPMCIIMMHQQHKMMS